MSWASRGCCIASVALVIAGACAGKDKGDEFEGLGQVDASSEPPVGVQPAIEPGDLTAVQKRGRLLYDMARALRLAHDEGLSRVAASEPDVIMPLVDVDPGGKSAQVVFLKWPPDAVGTDGEMKAEDAHRWMMVSLLLDPDRVLDIELLHGQVQPGSHEHVRAQAIIEAAKKIRETDPEQSFFMLALPEVDPQRGQGVVMRVYAFSAEGTGPDMELVFQPNKRKRKPKPPVLLTTRTTHPAGALERDPILLEALVEPAPMTVARVMLRGPQAEPVAVRTQRGAFRVSPADGRIVAADS